MRSEKYINIENCKHGFVYKIKSRNLKYGVFNYENAGFVGIRTKFSSRYLFCEYHYDNGHPFGTVFPLEELCEIPSDLFPVAYFPGSKDILTGRMVEFDKPIVDGGRGWYFIDTGEASDKIEAHTIGNPKLFEYLDRLENDNKL